MYAYLYTTQLVQYILVEVNAQNGWMEMVKEKIITINDSRYRPTAEG
jgi:hypothetical protein